MKSLCFRKNMAVPRINTDALAEKAKICKFNLVKGIRQHWPFSFGIRGVYICLPSNRKAFVDLSNKDGSTVYQKRSRLLIRNDLYNR